MVLGGYVASQKNRSICEGLVLGLFFGPLGVIAEGLMPNLVPPRRAGEPLTRKRRIEADEDLPPVVNWHEVGR
jgi:hypothetical protein